MSDPMVYPSSQDVMNWSLSYDSSGMLIGRTPEGYEYVWSYRSWVSHYSSSVAYMIANGVDGDPDSGLLNIIGDGGASCCPWGDDPDDWRPVALAYAKFCARQNGTACPQPRELDAAADAIVNCPTDEAWDLYQTIDGVPRPLD